MSPPPPLAADAAALARSLAVNPAIRALNFHNTPRSREAQYREQLTRLSQRFTAVTEDDLDRYLATGHWHKPKPGLIVSVFEGYRNGYDVMRPLLDELGLVGWYWVITGYVRAAPADQLAFAGDHHIRMQTREYPDGRYALSADELREIDRRHVVASHARSHIPIAPLDRDAMEGEVLGSQRDLQQILGHPVRSFVSYDGPPYGQHPPSDALIERAGFQFVFSNLRIQRLRARSPAGG